MNIKVLKGNRQGWVKNSKDWTRGTKGKWENWMFGSNFFLGAVEFFKSVKHFYIIKYMYLLVRTIDQPYKMYQNQILVQD